MKSKILLLLIFVIGSTSISAQNIKDVIRQTQRGMEKAVGDVMNDRSIGVFSRRMDRNVDRIVDDMLQDAYEKKRAEIHTKYRHCCTH